jgi:hypothetical protein
VRIEKQRARRDVAEPLRLLSGEDDPETECIVLVVDNANTPGPGSLSEAFALEEAHRLAACFKWHSTSEVAGSLSPNVNALFWQGSA